MYLTYTYSFFREPNIAYLKMRHSTDTDSRLPIHQHYNSWKAVGLTVQESRAVAGKPRDVDVYFDVFSFRARNNAIRTPTATFQYPTPVPAKIACCFLCTVHSQQTDKSRLISNEIIFNLHRTSTSSTSWTDKRNTPRTRCHPPPRPTLGRLFVDLMHLFNCINVRFG